MAIAFHCFPDLPKELRDDIWRLCLPCRVVELDRLDCGWYHDDPSYSEQPWLRCCLWPTTRANSAMPVISRVCHEARSVALRAGHVHFQDPGPDAYFELNTDGFWLDPTRDTLHLYWNWLTWDGYYQDLEEEPHHDLPGRALDSVRHLVATTESHPNITRSICADVLDEIDGGIMRLLERRPRWHVCTNLITIHVTDEAAAIRSGLWGLLGDERIVLVDAFDSVRVRQYQTFWQEHGIRKYESTAKFFEACVHGVPKIYWHEHTPEEYVLDLETRWLLRPFVAPQGASSPTLELLSEQVWLTQPRDFDGREDDPREVYYPNQPRRPFARELWVPKRDHPWVQDALSRMPDFCPAVMFRLCTSDCIGVKTTCPEGPRRRFPSTT